MKKIKYILIVFIVIVTSGLLVYYSLNANSSAEPTENPPTNIGTIGPWNENGNKPIINPSDNRNPIDCVMSEWGEWGECLCDPAKFDFENLSASIPVLFLPP